MKTFRLLHLLVFQTLSLISLATSLPDSLLDYRKAYTYNLTSIDTSLLIIQNLREKQMEPEWRLQMTEGDILYYGAHFQRAIPHYERALNDPALEDSSSVRMSIVQHLMGIYDHLEQDAELMHYIHELSEMGKRYGSRPAVAMADFALGKRLHFHRDTLNGYQLCRDAIESLKASNYRLKQNELRFCYAEMLMMYQRDGRYSDAYRMSKLQEALCQSPSKSRVRLNDSRALRHVYALRASLLAQWGRKAEADSIYTLWKNTKGGCAFDDKDILDYLMINGHYEEAHHIIHDYCDFLTAEGNAHSIWMLRMLLLDIQVHAAMDDTEGAIGHYMQLKTVADSLHTRVSYQQMSSAYKLLAEQEDDHRRDIILIVLLALVAIFCLFIFVSIYYTGLIRKRNKHLLKVLEGLEAYRQNAIQHDQQMIAQSQQGPSEEEVQKQKARDDEDRALFVELDKRVTADFLFLQPGLGRDDLCKVIGVDKNRFGRIMSRFSGASNASLYISTKRVEYGAQLLIDHPDYTISYIACECGMSNTVTFNRIFKDCFGLTPSEYRRNFFSKQEED